MNHGYAGAWLAPGAVPRLGAALARVLPETDSILDVGCGAASWFWPTGARPVGIDRSERAVHRFGVRGTACVGDAAGLPFAAASFDVVASIGLLHHLNDADAKAAIAEKRRVARQRVIVFDAVLPRRPWRRPLPWAIRRLDRGRWMRTEAALAGLLNGHGTWQSQRIAYSWTGLEGLLCVQSLR